nr:MAG TPA: hypothetical protein [Caudoviricetes sp.]
MGAIITQPQWAPHTSAICYTVKGDYMQITHIEATTLGKHHRQATANSYPKIQRKTISTNRLDCLKSRQKSLWITCG